MLIFKDFYLDDYLPQQTLTWCQEKLQNWGLQDLQLQDLCSDGSC